MASLPAHTRNYFTRGNVPLAATGSQLQSEGSSVWATVHVLLDLLQTGTASTLTARHANATYICRGSSDGVGGGGVVSAVGVAGTNRWWNGGVFPGLVRGTNGVNHHWMLLESVALGYEVLVNFSQNDSYQAMSVAKSGTFSGGSATNFPTPNDATKVTALGAAAYNGTDAGQAAVFGDTTGSFGSSRYLNMTLADSGEFICWYSRAGLGVFTAALSVWKSTGQAVADMDNLFVLSSTADSAGRGAWKAGHLQAAGFCCSRQPGGAQKTGGGLVVSMAGGVLALAGTPGDALTGFIDAEPMRVKDTAPQYLRRGSLPDLYMCGAETVGAPVPASGSTQIRTVLGDTVIPCIQVQPIT